MLQLLDIIDTKLVADDDYCAVEETDDWVR